MIPTLLITWFCCAVYCIWRTNKEYPQIEKDIVRNDPLFNAIGQIPPPVKKFGYFLTILFSPVLAPLFAYEQLEKAYYKHKLLKRVKKLKAIFAKGGSNAEIALIALDKIERLIRDKNA